MGFITLVKLIEYSQIYCTYQTNILKYNLDELYDIADILDIKLVQERILHSGDREIQIMSKGGIFV